MANIGHHKKRMLNFAPVRVFYMYHIDINQELLTVYYYTLIVQAIVAF
jgi:hypothetical protein